MKTFILVAGGIGIVLLILAGFACLRFLPDYLAESQTQASFRLYPDAEHVFDSLARYGGQSNIKRMYYQTSDPLEIVQSYYESFMPAFRLGDRLGDRQGQWNISGYNVDSTEQTPDSDAIYQIHEGFCSHTLHYNCITVSLVDLSQQQSLVTPATISWIGTYNKDELLERLNALPREGVLIVYAYYINDY